MQELSACKSISLVPGGKKIFSLQFVKRGGATESEREGPIEREKETDIEVDAFLQRESREAKQKLIDEES